MKAEDGIWINLKTENPSVALKRPDLSIYPVNPSPNNYPDNDQKSTLQLEYETIELKLCFGGG